jgi:multidrug efflux pump subunit AcrA (membrane-fusion protein)
LLETANAIDPESRTLLAQFVVDNKDYELLPGGYTQVHLKFPAVKNGVRIPVNTLLFRGEGLQVATLDKDNNVVLKTVNVSRDFGNEVEIEAGILPGEILVVNPSDSLSSGQHVQVIGSKTGKDKKS